MESIGVTGARDEVGSAVAGEDGQIHVRRLAGVRRRPVEVVGVTIEEPHADVAQVRA
jgi:hypothetical protein